LQSWQAMSDDEDSDYGEGGYKEIRSRDTLRQYEVVKKLGWGNFSTVWLCKCPRSQDQARESAERFVAVKVQKSRNYDDALLEVDTLKEISARRKGRQDVGVVLLHESFVLPGLRNGKHCCMVFNVMGPNLLHLVERLDKADMVLARKMTRDVLVGLEFLHDACVMIHADLKPENILISAPSGIPVTKIGVPMTPVVFPSDPALSDKVRQCHANAVPIGDPFRWPGSTFQLADLGSAQKVDKAATHFEDVGTTQYRAPELLVACNYSTGVDIWALGCTFFEVLCGEFLFNPSRSSKNRRETHLAQIAGALEEHLPFDIVERGTKGRSCYQAPELFVSERPRGALLGDRLVRYGIAKHTGDSCGGFVEFLRRMLRVNPRARGTAKTLLAESFMQDDNGRNGENGLANHEEPDAKRQRRE